ncbi:MAG TPA: helix-turn-helix transcriptional regulator [Chitinophagales bacterium]|nr:helix-turn-helix transcriptional regulator [Chitinophagales bacterium]
MPNIYIFIRLIFVIVILIKDKEIMLKFGATLKSIRKSKNLSQQALANNAEIELSQVYRIEKGKINPTLSTISNLAKALEIDIKDLFDF